MVAVSQFMPTNPRDRASVRAVLREHPELPAFIARVSAKADELFPGARITLDTIQHDAWDPPMRMLIWSPQVFATFNESQNEFVRWFVSDENNLRVMDEFLMVMPVWNGALETAR